jgi:hypothetical protein
MRLLLLLTNTATKSCTLRCVTRSFSLSGIRPDPFSALPPRVRETAERLSKALSLAAVPHAIVGAVACNAYGHRRATEDVDVLVNADALRAFCTALSGTGGWVPRYAGAKRSWRDASTRVDIDALVSGEYPGDGLPKAVSFPRLDIEPGFNWVLAAGGVRVLDLVSLISIKLASAASAPHRRKDAADVASLIEAQDLPREFATELDVTVRPLFITLWEEIHKKRTGGLQ